MFCPFCGTKLPEESLFCSECGSAVTNGWAAENQTPGEPVVIREEPPRRDPPGKPFVRKLLGWILILSLLIGAVCLGGTFIGRMGAKSMAELFSQGDWYYASIEQFDGTYVIRTASTEHQEDADRVWRVISGETAREIEEDIYDQVVSSENVSLFFMEEEGDNSFYLAVTPDGKMFVNEGESYTRYFEDAQEVYHAVKSFLPLGDEASLEYCLPSGSCSSLSISFYDQDMNEYDSVFVYDPDVIEGSLRRLRNGTVKYGGGIYQDFEGYMAMVGITEEDGDFYFLQIYEDGSADIPQHNWVYGVYEAVDFYNALWDELCLLKGY